jgi:diguanylate cyclase (GGDEF)-like protein
VYAVASVISGAARRKCDLVARYSAEQFAVVLPMSTREQALQRANAIQAALAMRAMVHETSSINKFVTVSIGVSSMQPKPQTGSAQLCHSAERALRRAKAEGRNQIHIEG